MYAQLTGGSSAKFGVTVCKASMVDYWGVHLPGRSAKFGVTVFKASMLNWGVDLLGRSAKYEICQVWCNGIQGIYAQLMGVDLPSLV